MPMVVGRALGGKPKRKARIARRAVLLPASLGPWIRWQAPRPAARGRSAGRRRTGRRRGGRAGGTSSGRPRDLEAVGQERPDLVEDSSEPVGGVEVDRVGPPQVRAGSFLRRSPSSRPANSMQAPVVGPEFVEEPVDLSSGPSTGSPSPIHRRAASGA